MKKMVKNHGINMKKVIRLNENDIKSLVKKIIRENKKSVNEGLFDWVRGMRFSDEEEGRLILKGIRMGEALNVREYVGGGFERDKGYEFDLGGYRIIASYYYALMPGGGGDAYTLKVDGEVMDVSNSITNEIMKEASLIFRKPEFKKRKEIKTSLNRYNLPQQEREDLENPETYFPQI